MGWGPGKSRVVDPKRHFQKPMPLSPLVRIDYVELRDADELTELTTVGQRAVLAIAAFVGTTRLIDNRVLS